MNRKLFFFNVVVLFVLLLAVWGCEGDVSSVSDDPYGPVEDAAVSFGVKWPEASGEHAVRSMTASLTDMSAECAARGVDKVRVRVIENAVWGLHPAILKSATFDCAAGQGSLTGIEPQEYCTIFVSGLNFIGNAIYEGIKSNVPLHPGMNNVGTIDLSDITAPSGDISNAIGMTFNYIESGTFMMGSPEDEPGRWDDERQHQVTLTNGYYMQTTPVTQGQWEAVMGSKTYYGSGCGSACPVERVSWNDVQVFISELNALEGTDRYALPTEAQWEYAARAGSTTAFANGPITETGAGYDPVLDSMGWYRYNSEVTYDTGFCHDLSDWGGSLCAGTHPVAQKVPNAWGLYDMHGNVYEWVADWYDTYPSSAVVDPTGPASGTYRVLRGGTLSSYAMGCRSAHRSRALPGGGNPSIGFRLVLKLGSE